jgi:uncharacterized membrane protein
MWLTMMAAGGVMAYAYTRRSRVPRASGHGTGVIADFESDTRQKLGGPRGVHVEESINVSKPIHVVYRFWRNFENLPKFMNHLDSVALREGGISHWVAKGPAGIPVEWDARIINEIDNKLFGWQSLTGSTIATAGSVNFDEIPDGTRVTVKMQYSLPAGKLGQAVAKMLGEDPGQAIDQDLQRFKELMETGTIAR